MKLRVDASILIVLVTALGIGHLWQGRKERKIEQRKVKHSRQVVNASKEKAKKATETSKELRDSKTLKERKSWLQKFEEAIQL